MATSAAKVGLAITDNVTLAEGFAAGGQLVFRAYGPGDQSCAGPASYEATVAGQRRRHHSPPGFAPGAGLYRWTVDYSGDANNEAALLGCGAPNQASTVGKASPTLVGEATSAAKAGPDDHRQRDPCRRLCGGRSARLPRLRAGGSELRQPCRLRSDGAGQRQRHLLPAWFCPWGGAVSVDGRIRGRCEQRNDLLACGAPDQASTVNKASPTLSGWRPPRSNPASRSPTA